jgi:acetyl-CoA carboxylase/biotin carboxylase 1
MLNLCDIVFKYKFIRSIRKWCYEVFGDERAVKFVVMATPEDIEVNSEYIKMADSYVRVPGASNCNNYANVKIILDIAQKSKVQVST